MTEALIPNPPGPTNPDPLKPYKAYAAAVGAAITEILNQNVWELDRSLEATLTVLAAAIAAYLIPNPAKRRKTPPNPRRNQMGPPRAA